MLHFSLLLVLVAGLFAVVVRSATFNGENLIRQVIFEELENGILRVVGETRDALSLARFAIRHRKRYDPLRRSNKGLRYFWRISHNSKGLSYKLGVNEFRDLTWDEFSRAKLMAPQNCSATIKGNLKLTKVDLPERKDRRETGFVSPVKDQGDCGSCWNYWCTRGSLCPTIWNANHYVRTTTCRLC